MKKKIKKKKEWIWDIEIPGWLGLIFLFLAIWIDGMHLKLALTGIFLWFIAIMNYAAKEKKK